MKSAKIKPTNNKMPTKERKIIQLKRLISLSNYSHKRMQKKDK
jgi:hypothetical protein